MSRVKSLWIEFHFIWQALRPFHFEIASSRYLLGAELGGTLHTYLWSQLVRVLRSRYPTWAHTLRSAFLHSFVSQSRRYGPSVCNLDFRQVALRIATTSDPITFAQVATSPRLAPILYTTASIVQLSSTSLSSQHVCQRLCGCRTGAAGQWVPHEQATTFRTKYASCHCING